MTDNQQELAEPRDWTLEVVSVRELTSSMRRVAFAGPGLGDLEYLPGQDMALAFPLTPPVAGLAGRDPGIDRGNEGGRPPRAGAGERTVRRRYTIRRLYRTQSIVEVDFVLHGDGPAARWAAAASPGNLLEAVAPRGKITLDHSAAWHLFVGDDAAVPTTAAMIEALPKGASALAILEVEGGADEQAIDEAAPHAADVQLIWVHRNGTEPGRSTALVEAVTNLATPVDQAHAYVAGEFGIVNSLRKILRSKGLSPEQISPKPYWRLGFGNADHGEPVRD